MTKKKKRHHKKPSKGKSKRRHVGHGKATLHVIREVKVPGGHVFRGRIGVQQIGHVVAKTKGQAAKKLRALVRKLV